MDVIEHTYTEGAITGKQFQSAREQIAAKFGQETESMRRAREAIEQLAATERKADEQNAIKRPLIVVSMHD